MKIRWLLIGGGLSVDSTARALTVSYLSGWWIGVPRVFNVDQRFLWHASCNLHKSIDQSVYSVGSCVGSCVRSAESRLQACVRML